MKKFYDSGEYFVMSSYRITAVPITEDNEASIGIAKTICEDACYLSSEGNGQTAIEIIRIAGTHTGSRIQHLLIVRTHDASEKNCVIRQEALAKGIISILNQNGYKVDEISFDAYRKLHMNLKSESAWALKKQAIQEYGVQGTYRSPPIVEAVDWKKIYSSLDGSGCSLCIQIIPSLLSEGEHSLVAKNATQCSQAVDGIVPNMRDSLAASSADRWKRLAQNALHPFAEVNIMVLGAVANAALVTARIKQSVYESSFNTVAIPEFSSYSIYNQPWKIAFALRANHDSGLKKWTSDEVSQIFQLPSLNGYFIGIEGNAFSQMPEAELLPETLNGAFTESLRLGKSIFSSQNISLPFEQFLLHTAILGKSGVGKTTLLKQMITQFRQCNIPVLILEPVKREYRDMINSMGNTKVFTVERPITPLLINPFYVPDRVSLGEYRSSLLSAFKAAFSLPDPLPALFEKAISEAYLLHGWTDRSKSSDPDITVFDMVDFIHVFKQVIIKSSYSNEVKGNMMSGGAFRLQSLVERCPRTFDTIHSTAIEDLLSGCSIVEMGCLEPEQKSLISALTLISILAYLKVTRESDANLRNIILIDEAHALLDQGEGATQEEKALNSTMTQLMINVITEIRAYGVGIVFSDQTPSRVGGRMLDNVDNIISFRLSGEEAEMLKQHIGEDERVCDVLPLMETGEFVLKNRFIGSALPIKTEYDPRETSEKHVTDAQIVNIQSRYLATHTKDYCPFALCESVGCKHCALSIREEANKCAAQIFSERYAKMKTPEEIAAHIIKLPKVLLPRLSEDTKELFLKKCNCVAIHLLRRCYLEKDISFSQSAVMTLLADMNKQLQRKEILQ